MYPRKVNNQVPGGLFLAAGGRDMEVVFDAQGRTFTSS